MNARLSRHLIATLLAFFVVLVGVRADDDADIDQNLAKIEKATSGRDYETLINMMYSPIVQAGGGHDALVSQAKALGDQIDQSSMKSIKPYRHISGKQNDYVLIPTETIIKMGGTRNEITSAELAIRPHGSSQWQYVDTGGMNPQIQAAYFSDLPSDFELPQRTTKLLGPDTTSPAQPSNSTDAVTSDSSVAGASPDSEETVSPWDKEALHAIYILVGVAGAAALVFLVLIVTWYVRPRAPKSGPPVQRVPPLK